MPPSITAGLSFVLIVLHLAIPSFGSDQPQSSETDQLVARRPIANSLCLDLPYVQTAEIIDTRLFGHIHKTLLLTFRSPQKLVSTLEGFRKAIRYAGNSYSPPPVWKIYHRLGLAGSRERLLQVLGKQQTETSLLFTGADMDNLSVQKKSYRTMHVYALVTAGVSANAVRMSQDTGAYYEPGTINIILLANMNLSPRAMNRAVIAATEAKTAALQDLDIRSSQTPLTNPATGTGTDNIIVVTGEGCPIDNAGGHCKMGELIAAAVYAGVQEAVFKQNGLCQKRGLLQRLKERRIGLAGLTGSCGPFETDGLTADLEALLAQPRYAGFIETALVLSDAYERSLVADLGAFEMWCRDISTEIAGRPVTPHHACILRTPLPLVLKTAFEALLNGLLQRSKP